MFLISGVVVEERHEVERLTALSSTSVEVKWRGSREAVLVYRQEGTEQTNQKMTLVPPPPSHSTTRIQTIYPLMPSANYVFCIARATTPSTYTVDPSNCRRVQTPSNPTPLFSDVSISDTSVRLRWRLDGTSAHSGKEWRIRVRKGGASTAHYHHISSDGKLHEYSVTDLTPRTDYEVCVEEVGGEEACVTVRTEGEDEVWEGLHTAVGVAVFLGIMVIVVGLAILYKKRGLLSPVEETRVVEVEEEEEPVPQKEELGGVGIRNYSRSWNTLRLPSHDHAPPPLFRSFRRPCDYRDHLTSVTIYSSGHSEC